jgi:23S rRNA pseudouridine1911/1915/1917 synthase
MNCMINKTEKIAVIYQDKNLLVINKPAGLLVHPVKLKAKSSKLKAEPTLASWLLENYPETGKVGDDPANRPGIVHRLDRETSGIMIIARNQETFDYLKSQFQQQKFQKTYLALVFGKVENKTGRIEKPIGIKSGTTKRSVLAKKMKMVKEAITDYEVISYHQFPRQSASGQREAATFSLLKVMPRTGRTHQIRVHLAAIGHPVMGDKVYGGKRGELTGLNRQFLHAQSIEFTGPDGERVKFEADLPKELQQFLTPNP